MGSIEEAAQQMLAVLEKSVSHNPDDQKRATEYIESASQNNFPIFVRCLSMILRTTQCQSFVRQAAGIQLKNVLYSKETQTRHDYLMRWLALEVAVREDVKNNVLTTLGTEPSRPSIAAQCVAAIACAELPAGSWREVITQLMSNVTNPASGELLKESSLETLGYICQDIDPKVLESQSNDILTAIVHGMRREETSNHVKLAATNALTNSLEFTDRNFSNEPERDIIMSVVCSATKTDNLGIKIAAIQCMVKSMTLYYKYMEKYMPTGLFPCTVEAMQSEEPNLSMQGMEFWSTVAEEEILLQEAYEEALENQRETNQPAVNENKNYIKQACNFLVPILLNAMANHEDDVDEEDWSPSKAAGVGILLITQCVGDDVVEHVVPFLNNFQHADWKFREAALMAFGSILDGPTQAKLQPIVDQAFPSILAAMSDPNVSVRDTAAWTLGRIIDSVPQHVCSMQFLTQVLPVLSQGLQQEPRVANNICWTLVSLVKTIYDTAVSEGCDASGTPPTCLISSVYPNIVGEILKVADRPDSNQSNLRITAYETLIELIKNSAKDCSNVVLDTMVVMLKRADQLVKMEQATTSSTERVELFDVQGLICSTLQCIIRKIDESIIPQISDNIVAGLITIMSRAATVKSAGSVMEYALYSIAALAEKMGRSFKYLSAVMPFLLASLDNLEESQVIEAAVGALSDFSRAAEKDIEQYIDQAVEKLFRCLQAPRLSKEAKGLIVSVFGDIALALEDRFAKFVPYTTQLLIEAEKSCVADDPNDLDQVDYVNSLRYSILTTYTGMIQAFNVSTEPNETIAKNRQTLGHFVDNVCKLIKKCATSDPVPASDEVIGSCCGIIGDLCEIFKEQAAGVLSDTSIVNMIAKAKKSKTGKTKSIASYAQKALKEAQTKAQSVNFSFAR